ncbi:MAG: transposase [Halobacteriota archaeon]|nr:transposase [Halobacteriota archaeon]
MIIRKAYKFRLKTNPEIEELFFQFAGCNRKVWNMALALQKDALDKIQKIYSYNHLAGCLVDWKQTEELSFLKTAPSQTLQQTLKALDRAMKDAFDKKQSGKRFPVWKKKFKCVDSFRYPQGFKLEGNRVFLPKIGWVRFHKSRDIQGTPRNMTVSRKGKYWFVSIQTEQDILIPERTVYNPYDVVGIDMGVTRFVTTSQTDETGIDGSFVEPLNSFKKLKNKLARAQRLLARKHKFSNNWKKQKQVVSNIHIKIADARNDFLQKLSTIMSKNHAVIVVEDLKIKSMSSSAKGDMEQPGKNVKAKAGLNKSILDQGWGNFLRMIGYKQEWSGGKLIRVDPKNTSRTCPECNHVSAENRKTQALFLCTECGYSANSDYVAAVNIKARGIKQLGGRAGRYSLWRDGVSRPLKQEPVGTSDQVPLLTPA